LRKVSRRAVIFDLGGVVFDSPLHALRTLEREKGLPRLSIGRAIESAGRDGAWARLERGELEYGEFQGKLQQEMDAAGLPLRVPEMMRAMAGALRVRPEMLAAIRSLRFAGFRVGALTNNWPGEGIDRFRTLQPEFDAFVQSYLVGRRKPEPEVYALVCEALAISPSEAVFLDDIGANLKPARALGMGTIKVGEPARALADLEEMLAPGWQAPR